MGGGGGARASMCVFHWAEYPRLKRTNFAALNHHSVDGQAGNPSSHSTRVLLPIRDSPAPLDWRQLAGSCFFCLFLGVIFARLLVLLNRELADLCVFGNL